MLKDSGTNNGKVNIPKLIPLNHLEAANEKVNSFYEENPQLDQENKHNIGMIESIINIK